ncbi:hypothetical protein [Phenylobacterium sp.]|jgi:hypothetical protein|uniref:hypothetical protein n=1 Tax=Phenylobacterium sp. TaxID=1871053 RepID=UPI002F930D82
MRTLLLIVGVLAIVVGNVWVLQGLNILPGSFMTGDIRWTWYGGLLDIAGLALILVSRRKRAVAPAQDQPEEP